MAVSSCCIDCLNFNLQCNLPAEKGIALLQFVNVTFFKRHSLKGEAVKDTIWVPYGILFQEFHDYNPKLAHAPVGHFHDLYNTEMLIRMLWTAASFLIVTSFSSTLRSQLIAQEYGKPLNNLGELYNESQQRN